jgi:hypothetical protein
LLNASRTLVSTSVSEVLGSSHGTEFGFRQRRLSQALEEAVDPIERYGTRRSDLYANGSPVGREIDD